MKIRELIALLEFHDGELEVVVFDDWGSSFVLRSVTNVLESTEFQETEEAPVVVLCFKIGTE